MIVDFVHSVWGLETLSFEQVFELVSERGFAGVEMKIPEDKRLRSEVASHLQSRQLQVVAQLSTYGRSSADHIRDLERKLKHAREVDAALVNTHIGRDYFSLRDNLAVLRRAEELAAEYQMEIVHETHRGRATFSAISANELLSMLPELKVNADFSHRCCVHESLLEELEGPLQLAIQHSHYIHARVGHAEGPQVNDPRAPEWDHHLARHLDWWTAIIEQRQAEGKDRFFVCPEFGPPEYLPTLPYTQMPVADLWSVNHFIRDVIIERLSALKLAKLEEQGTS